MNPYRIEVPHEPDLDLNTMKTTTALFNQLWIVLALACLTVQAGAAPLAISFEPNSAPLRFAVAEIQAASAAAATLPPLSVMLSVDEATLSPQFYRIQRADGKITVTGGDAVGAMYGGLDVAEAIRTGALDSLKDSVHSPHIAQRGIKFNIPLDLRTPSYTDPSDAAQANIPEVWSLEFWREMFDDMARHRYNLISLWSLNPFPSIVKVPEFPHVALDDVWRTKEKLDADFDGNGNNFVKPAMLANHDIVKKMTMDEKIRFWREVMQLATDRGVDVYWFTWNVFLFGAEGKDGITSDKTAPRTIVVFPCQRA